ncbi:hypothetical protein GG344DRAFT_69013 [Lentinula edodes]|nr:hypothetical protein GG344DRAFT_69013 [Lentinula edodes]
MHLNQLFVYLLLGIVSGAAGAPVSSNVIASSELTKGITERSYARGANVESGSDLDIRTIGALSQPTQIVVPVDSHSVMEARTEDISEGWEEVHHPGQAIHHPGQAPGKPTESTAAVHPEPPRTDAKVPEQKPKAPESKTTPVSLSLTWQGIESADVHDKRVSVNDMLIRQEAVELVEKAAESIWKLRIWHLNRDDSCPVTHSNSIETAEFKFLLKLEYDGAEGENYCEGRVKGESDNGCIGIIRFGKGRKSELINKDGVVVEMGFMSGAPPRSGWIQNAPPHPILIHNTQPGSGWIQIGSGGTQDAPLHPMWIHNTQPGSGQIHGASPGSGWTHHLIPTTKVYRPGI